MVMEVARLSPSERARRRDEEFRKFQRQQTQRVEQAKRASFGGTTSQGLMAEQEAFAGGPGYDEVPITEVASPVTRRDIQEGSYRLPEGTLTLANPGSLGREVKPGMRLGDYQERTTINQGPGVAGFDEQRAAIRDLRNFRRKAEGSAPVGGAAPSVAIAGGTSGGAMFDRVPSREMRNVAPLQGSRSQIREAGAFQRDALKEAGKDRRSALDREAQLEQTRLRTSLPTTDAFNQQLELARNRRDEERLQLDKLQLGFEQGLAKNESFRDQQKFVGDQIADLSEQDTTGLAGALSPILREFADAGQAPTTTLSDLQKLLGSGDETGGIQETVENLLQGTPEQQQQALNSIREFYLQEQEKQR